MKLRTKLIMATISIFFIWMTFYFSGSNYTESNLRIETTTENNLQVKQMVKLESASKLPLTAKRKLINKSNSSSVIPKNAREHGLLSLQLGGWHVWLELVQLGELDISNLSTKDKDWIFEQVSAFAEPSAIEDLIALGFEVPDTALFAVINADLDMTLQENKVLEKLGIISNHTGYTKHTKHYKFGPSISLFDQAVAFGFINVSKELSYQGVLSASPDKLYQSFLKGRQPSIEGIEYLLSLNYEPPSNIKEIARQSNLNKSNPELFKYIQDNF